MKKILLLMAFALPFVFISCGDDKDEPVDDHDDHEYVDLGLPSGTLWATCNIGANAPEEDGEYWSCTLYDCPFINGLYFAMTVEGYAHWGNNYPYIGQSVRAVRVQQN